MFNFLVVLTIMIVISLLYRRDNRTIHYAYSTYSKLFKDLDEYGCCIKSYFQTLFTYTLICLLFSLFNLPNNIINDGDYSFFYIISLFNLVLFVILGVRKNGFKKILKSFFISVGDSKYLMPFNIFISLLLFSMNYILKPIVLPSRLVINGMIGESMHHCIAAIKYGALFSIIITCLKLIIYFIQAYIFFIFSFDLFSHMYKVDNKDH